MVIELISVGTEILLGNIVNTNAKYLAQECAALGYFIYYQTSVGDNEKRLEEVFKDSLNRSDIVILTGGLGPTKDDLTKEVVAKALGLNLAYDAATLKFLEDFFKKRSKGIMPENNLKQAMIPEGSLVLKNNNGTAPGIIIENDEKTVIILPGPPNEMIPMFNEQVSPYLKNKQTGTIYSVMVKMCGIGESDAEQRLADIIDKQSNPTIAPYAKMGEVHFRITAKAEDEYKAKKMIEPVLEKIKSRLGQYIYTYDEEKNLEDIVVEKLIEKGITISVAESCTGGLLSGKIINVPGSSKVIKESYITYSNEAKVKTLNVKKETLEKFGAVSEETVTEMAKGCHEVTGANVCVSTSGIAGPDGGTTDKPVGLVYICCYYEGELKVIEYNSYGNRQKNRENTVQKALTMLWNILK